MESTKTYVFPEGGNSGDNAALMAALNNGGGFNNGSWLWVLFTALLFGWNRGGGFLGGGNNGNGCGCAEKDLLMQAFQGNANAVNSLAGNLNCSIGDVQQAINAIQNSLGQVGGQVGLSAQQIINAIQQGNMNLAQQLAQCCCDQRLATCQQTNDINGRINQLANGVTQGFSATAYETAQQTCTINQNIQNGVQSLKDNATANNNAVIAKLNEMQANAMQDKLAGLQSQNAALKAQIDNAQQTATFAAMLQPIQAELNAIKAAQPATTTVQYPQLTAIPTAMLNNGFGYGYGYGNGFWS